MLEFTHGDMFEAAADIRVNTVNCVGVMGAGVALAFKQRYPEMFKDYQRDCKNGRVVPGRMHVWKSLSGDWIVNFPTKRDWREPSRYEDIDSGLDDLRRYLETLGPVTVALPALGCGHGGLDWSRVSGMIRDKLMNIDAHVLVFEPAASHQAGRTATEAPTDDERNSAAKVGYQLIEPEGLPGLSAKTPIYLRGDRTLLAKKWIALFPARAPADREIQALTAIAAQLARSGSRAPIALVHGGRVSEDIAQIFAGQGIDTILLLPFGVLTRKSVAKGSAISIIERPMLISAAPANAKWSRHIFAQTMDMARSNADALLVSDPEPEWLIGKGLAKWSQVPISYVRYESTPPYMREALAGVGARPIGRRGEDGTPNIDYLISRWSNASVADGEALTLTVDPTDAPARAADAEIGSATITKWAANLSTLSVTERDDLFELLLRMDTAQVDIAIGLAQTVSDGDLLKLRGFGFTLQDSIDPSDS